MQKTQVIDISRSAIITDPEAFYENLMATGVEDSPEKMMPIVAYEGYNWLPTVYGYRSYFDVSTTLNIGALPARCDKLVNFQLSDYSNLLVALAEDGIYTNPGKAASVAWTKEVSSTAPPSGQYKEWTFCVIENKLYMYRQGSANVYLRTNVPGASIVPFTPSFLNMAGQMGIFRANGRLGFWDSANSISWSSVFDHADFTPSIETLAGNAIFNDVLGRITAIIASGSGFVIYSTRNIVGAAYSADGSVIFSAHTIAEVAGVWFSRQVCSGVTDTEHYAYTNTGIKRITNAGKVETVFAPIFDFLRESKEPVSVDFLQGRYLFINVINPAYISGYVTFVQEDVSEYTIRFLFNGGEATTPPGLPEEVDGVSLEDSLTNKIKSSLRDGIYAVWNASGSKLVPSRIPSPMNPYELDDPFTPDDDHPYTGNTTHLYTPEEIMSMRDTGYFITKVSITDGIPFALDLGWQSASNGTGKADSGLARIRQRQIAEWDEYVSQYRDFVDDVHTYGSSSTDVHKSVDQVIFNNTVPAPAAPSDTGYIEIGSIPYPDWISITTTEEFTGEGTYHPEYSLKRSYSYKTPIKRRVLATDYVYQTWTTYVVDGQKSPGVYFGAAGNEQAAEYMEIALGGSFPLDSNVPTLPYNAPSHAPEWEALKGYMASQFVPSYYDAFVDKTYYLYDVLYFCEDWHNGSWSWPVNPSLGVHKNLEVIGRYWDLETKDPILSAHDLRLIAYCVFGYYWVKRTEKFLITDNSVEQTPQVSELKANQRVLDWAIYTTEAPPAGFNWSTNEMIIGSTIPFILDPTLPKVLGITYPGASFLLQDAAPAPIYPDYVGSLVYDTYLQKWGKMKAVFRALVDYSPLNSSNKGSITYSNFGLEAGTLDTTGYVHLFSSECPESGIRYGKFAMSRQGFTSIETIDIKFRKPFTGSIDLDTSLDGRSLHSGLHQTESFVRVGLATITPDYNGRWFVITIIGKYDLRSIEFTGKPAGLR